MINIQTSRIQPNFKSIFDNILKINLDQSDISICLASTIKNSKDLKFERLQLEERLLIDFKKVLKDNFKRLKKDSENSNLIIHKYDAGSKLDSHEIEYINLSEYNFVQAQIGLLAALPDIDIFTGNRDFIDGLRFYVFVVQQQDEPVYCFRVYSQKKELGRSKNVVGLLVDNRLRRMQGSVFSFDNYIDCISQGSNLFILKKGNFHKIFRFFNEVVQIAEITLKQIKHQIEIINFNEFEQACMGNIQMMSKLKNIACKPYFKHLSINHMERIIKKYNMPIQVIKQGSIGKIVFELSNKWIFLRLLDDDYLESIMTNQSYEVSSKRVF